MIYLLFYWTFDLYVRREDHTVLGRTSLEEKNLVAFYYLYDYELIRGVDFGGNYFIEGGLLYLRIGVMDILHNHDNCHFLVFIVNLRL
jgi:hypothetical protein